MQHGSALLILYKYLSNSEFLISGIQPFLYRERSAKLYSLFPRSLSRSKKGRLGYRVTEGRWCLYCLS